MAGGNAGLGACFIDPRGFPRGSTNSRECGIPASSGGDRGCSKLFGPVHSGNHFLLFAVRDSSNRFCGASQWETCGGRQDRRIGIFQKGEDVVLVGFRDWAWLLRFVFAGGSGKFALTSGMADAWKKIGLAAAACCLGAGAWVLYTKDPEACGFYPPCLFHKFTSLLCPGCGSTRSLHALLNLDLFKAISMNPLLIGAIPVLILFCICPRATRWKPVPILAAGVILGFWVLRNMPGFEFLAPPA